MDGNAFIGETIGEYPIKRVLGEGGMALVLEGVDPKLGRSVAVKILKVQLIGSAQDFLKRFERETRLLLDLQHPNIVQILDSGTTKDNLPYLVMPLYTGGTLKDRVGRPMPYQQAARLLAPVAEALAYAHRQGIIHRDVKPSNILLTESGDPMLADFGIAKLFEGEQITQTPSGSSMGTPGYMAPEQWEGKVIPQTDVFALGMAFYELVTGRNPHRGDTPKEAMFRQFLEPLPPPRRYIPDLPPGVEQQMLRALEKDPGDRYPDMAAFAAVLRGLMISGGASGSEEETWFSPPPGSFKALLRRAVPWLIGAGVLALVALIAVLARPDAPPAQEADRPTVVSALATPTTAGKPPRDTPAGAPAAAPTPGEAAAPAGPTAAPTGERPSLPIPIRGKQEIGAANATGITELGRWGQGVVEDAAYSLDGSRVFLATSLGIRVLDPATLRTLQFLPSTSSVRALAFSSDGAVLAAGYQDGLIRTYLAADLSPLGAYDGQSGPVSAVSFSPDGRMIAAACQGIRKQALAGVYVWDTSSGRLIHSITSENPAGGAAFSPDGKYLVAAFSRWPIQLWSTASWKKLAHLDDDYLVKDGSMRVAFSSDGQLIGAVGSQGRLWQVEPLGKSHPLPVLNTSAERIAFSPDTTLVAVLYRDQTVKVWNTRTGLVSAEASGIMPTGALAYSPDGQRLLVSRLDGTLLALNAADLRIELSGETLAQRQSALAVDPRGERLAAAQWDGSVNLHDPGTGAVLQHLTGPLGRVLDLAFSPGGDLLAAGGSDNTLWAWETSVGGPGRAWRVGGNPFAGLAFTRDGQSLLAGDTGGSLRVFSAPSGQEVQRKWQEIGRFGQMVISPDGGTAAIAVSDGSVALWNIADLTKGRSLDAGDSPLLGVAYAPGGDTLSAVSEDGRVIYWRLKDRTKLWEQKEAAASIYRVVYSADGSLLVSAAHDGRLLFHRARDGQLLHAIQAHNGPITGMVLLPGGREIATCSEDGTVRVWGIP